MGTLCDRSTALIDSGAISFVVTSGQETLLHMLSEPGIYCAPTVAEQALEATVFPRAPLPQLIRALLELVQAIADRSISSAVDPGQEMLQHMPSEPGIYHAPTVAEQALEEPVFQRAPLPQLLRALLELVQAIAAAAATEAGAACLPDVQEHLLPRAGMQTVWGKPACCASARWSC